MMRGLRRYLVPALLAVGVAGIAWPQHGSASGIPVTDTLFYAGVLQEGGAPVDGTRAMTLLLWDDATAAATANKKCETTSPTTSVAGGRFRIPLDVSCVEAVRTNADLYIEIIVGSTSLGRKKLGAVPYAVEADRAGNATGALAEELATLGGRIDGVAAVPAGAVMAFDLASCPPGWSAFAAAEGRTIVGATTAAPRGTQFGADAVTLSVAQMPAHNHSATQAAHDHAPSGAVNFITGGGDPAVNAGIQLNSGGYHYAPRTAPAQPAITVGNTGGGQAFDNRQASLALTYCRKD